jgi:hypothetical protein
MRAPFEESVGLERGEVVLVGGRRGQADGVGDLAHRGWVAALGDRAGDAVEDALPALLVVPGHCEPPWVIGQRLAERMF